MATGFAIIGCGLISKFHARAIADVPGAELVACYDRVPEAADRLAAETGCKAYHSLEALLADPRVEVVTVATPSGAHLEPAVAAARAGKHVIVEKPLEITLERCDAIIRACEESDVVLSTIFPSRFHDVCQLIKKAVDAGRFGRLVLGDAYVKWWRSQQYYDSGAWRGTWELDGGGALMNQAIHSVDLLLWFMGPLAEVRAEFAMLGHERIAVEDVAVAALRFANGALGTIEATTAAYPGHKKRIEIHGTAGGAIMEEEDLVFWQFAQPQPEDEEIQRKMSQRVSGSGGAADPAAIGHHGHARQFADVLRAIQTGGKPLVDGPEGRRAVEAILAIYLSAERGEPVRLPLKEDPKLNVRQSGVAGHKQVVRC
jgi:predicted dehydrogenase